jgi:hypothetical protein
MERFRRMGMGILLVIVRRRVPTVWRAVRMTVLGLLIMFPRTRMIRLIEIGRVMDVILSAGSVLIPEDLEECN